MSYVQKYYLEFDGVIAKDKPIKLERGMEVKRCGICGVGRLVACEKHPDDGLINKVVVAWKGYGENPGSRYSGLYSYYPATTEVFLRVEIDKFDRISFVSFMEWQTRPERKK